MNCYSCEKPLETKWWKDTICECGCPDWYQGSIHDGMGSKEFMYVFFGALAAGLLSMFAIGTLLW